MNDWQLAPAGLDLEQLGIDVWSIDVDPSDQGLGSLLNVLSAGEAERAGRFKFAKDRRLFITAHAALRSILAQYLRTSAASLAFSEGANGKPYLAAPTVRLQFNLSHSHQRALLALSFGREVGVDIEYVQQEFGYAEVAARFFTAAEVAAMRNLPSDLQRQAFFKCWTSKEAFLKAKGTGLSGKLDEVEITLAADGQVKIFARVPGWSLSELHPIGAYEGALVVCGSAVPIRYYRWQWQ